jgi:hypothetical protein
MGVNQQNQPIARTPELCVRCKQPLSFQEPKCPNCGQPVSGMTRNLSLLIGVGGVGAILFVVLLMWLVVHEEDVMNRPVPVDDETAARQSEILPDTSATGTSATADKEPAKPDKAPPLNK